MTTTYTKIDENNFKIAFVTSDYTTNSFKESETVQHNGFKWHLRMKRYEKGGDQLLGTHLICDGNGSGYWKIDVQTKFNLIKRDGTVGMTDKEAEILGNNKSCGFNFQITIQSLKNGGFIKDGKITIECINKINSVMENPLKRRHSFEVEEKELNSVVMEVEGKKFYVNGGFLAAHSAILLNLLYPDGIHRKARHGQIIDGVKSEEFDQFLRYMSRIEFINENNLESVLKVSQRLDMILIKQQCVNFLFSNDDIAKYTKLEYADKFNLKDLQTSTLNSIKTSAELKEINEHADNLSKETLRALFQKALDVLN